MGQRYVIECRKTDGSLDFADPQPSSVFGMAAITGISEDSMAKAIFRKMPGVVLDGRELATWPSKIDPRWYARKKTW